VSIRQGANTIAERWARSARALKKEDRRYGERLAELAKMHSSEAFAGCDDALEGVVFSVLVEIFKAPGPARRRGETAVWILDSTYRDGCVDLWVKDGGTVQRVRTSYDPPFFCQVHDPAACHEMIEALGDQYGAEECSIRTVFGEDPGYAVYAGRAVAEANRTAGTVRCRSLQRGRTKDQRFMAEEGIVPCTGDGEDRFSPLADHSLSLMEVRVQGDFGQSAQGFEIAAEYAGESCRFAGTIHDVLDDFSGYLAACDPDTILMPDSDTLVPRLLSRAEQHGITMPFSRNGNYRGQSSRSYWSYGKMEHKGSALIPDGRILIDTEQSFVYQEGGLSGVLMAARLSGLSPNLAARFTPGTLISSYEIREAVRQGIAVPFRKSEPEQLRTLAALQAADRGGMMFQPVPGTYEDVGEIDFTSLYPSIIAHENLSPETLGHPCRPGFLSGVLRPVLDLRIRTKQQKKTDPRFAGPDAILKWMLVTCFGYTGYRNAKFGRIEVHEAITAAAREILVRTKEIAEEMGYSVLHGIVDSLWVQGAPIGALKARVEQELGYALETGHFDWLVFLPLADGFGAYNRYYGRLFGREHTGAGDRGTPARYASLRERNAVPDARGDEAGADHCGTGNDKDRDWGALPGCTGRACCRLSGADDDLPPAQPDSVPPPMPRRGRGAGVP